MQWYLVSIAAASVDWSVEDRSQFLVKSDIISPLSIDPRIWPRSQASPNESKDIFSGLYQKSVSVDSNEVLIFISIVEAYFVRFSEFGFCGQGIQRDLKAEIIGYDVSDPYYYSGISNFDLGLDFDEKCSWASRINDQGLFSNSSHAVEFASLLNGLASEHSPFFVFGLYRV